MLYLFIMVIYFFSDNDDKQKEEPKDGSSNTIDKNGKLDSTKGRKRQVFLITF